MENVDVRVAGDKLILTIDLSKGPGGVSASGKTRSVASTHGNVKVAYDKLPGLSLGVNCYVPNR